MFTLEGIVRIVIYLLVAGMIFGALFYLINYIAANFPGFAPFAGFVRVALMILVVLFLIGLLLSAAGHPIIIRT